jgi:hypothetical protein
MAKVKCDIRSILGTISDVNNSNQQKVVAMATWADNDETVNIRRYNVADKLLLNGISLSLEEAEELVYVLLENLEVNFDRKRIMDSADGGALSSAIEGVINIKDRLNTTLNMIDINKLMSSLDDNDELYEGDYIRKKSGYIRIVITGDQLMRSLVNDYEYDKVVKYMD